MYRLAILLTLLIALAAAGCGDSGDDSGSAPSAVAGAPESAQSGDDGDGSASSEAKKKNDDSAEKSSGDEDADEAEDDDEPKSNEEFDGDQEAAFAKLPPEAKSDLIETVVRSALLSYGLKLTDVQVRNGGRAATAIVARRGACNFVASQEQSLVETIKQGAPVLKSVRFKVAGTGQQLGYYVLGCKKPEIPSGTGRVLLDHSGVGGPYTSKRFTIKSKRWALEWVNEAASLAAVIVPVGGESKEEERSFKPVGSQKPESGRYAYTGRGTFQIKAYGAGGWRFRVKEIR
jgi:hypothetical protein